MENCTRSTIALIVSIAALFVALIGSATVYFVQNEHEKDAATNVNLFKNITKSNRAGIFESCLDIEQVKRQIREDAQEDYANLERNARLLQIELTPELRAQVKADFEATMRRFAMESCKPEDQSSGQK
jgi:uncharacterized membrane protein